MAATAGGALLLHARRLLVAPAAVHPCPWQIGSLRNLRHLYLRNPYGDPSTYSALVQLPLTRLELGGLVHTLPSCLSALTLLEALSVNGEDCDVQSDQEMAQALCICHALPRLTRLTFLALSLMAAAPLAHLTALPSLRSLYWCYPQADDAAALPPGSWLSSLQALGAPLPLLARSLAVLGAAQRLQEVSVSVDPQSAWKQELPQLLRRAPRHRSLRRVLLDRRVMHAEVWEAVAAASRTNPSLCISAQIVNPINALT